MILLSGKIRVALLEDLQLEEGHSIPLKETAEKRGSQRESLQLVPCPRPDNAPMNREAKQMCLVYQTALCLTDFASKKQLKCQRVGGMKIKSYATPGRLIKKVLCEVTNG